MGITSLSPRLNNKPPNKRLFCCNHYTGCAILSIMETKRHNLSIPIELYEKIEYLAEKDMRSVNKECVFLLGQIVEQRRDDLRDFQQENKNDE